MRTRIAFVAPALLAAALVAGCSSTRGHQNSKALEDSIRDTVAAVDTCGSCRSAALASMNTVLAEPIENLDARYATFDGCVDRVVASDASLRSAVAAMKSSAAERYRSWGEESLTYDDDEMQVRSQKGRSEARESFRGIEIDVDAMLLQSAAFVTYLSDFRRVLSNDLSRKGVADVRDFAEKAQDSSDDLDGMGKDLRKKLGTAADAMTSVASAN